MMKVLMFTFISFAFMSCQYFADPSLEEKLIQFSDENKLVSEADRIQLRVKYYNEEGRLMDSV